MAILFPKKTSEIGFIFTIIINFAIYGYTSGQCLNKDYQDARCNNMNYDLGRGQCWVKNLKECLEEECITISGSSQEKDCKNPPKKVIPGFNPLRINKTLTIEAFLQEVLMRTVIHIIHNKEIRQHFKSGKCHRETKLVKYQMKRIRRWITRTQRDLGFLTVIQGSMPPKLTSTGANSSKDWYDVQMQMLINLSLDFSDMRGYFQSSSRINSCIIPIC